MARKKTVESPTRSPKPIKSKRTGKAKPARRPKAKKSAGAKRASTARKKTTKAPAGKKATTRKASTKKRKASAKSAPRSRTSSSKPKASRATVKRKKVTGNAAKKSVRKAAKKVAGKTVRKVTKKTAKRSPPKAVRKPAKKTASVKRTSKTVSRSKKKSAAKRKTSPRQSVQKAVRAKNNRPFISTAKSHSKAPSVHTPATEQDPIQFVEEIKIPRTKLTAIQLESFKELLLAKRRELDGDARNLSLGSRSRGGGQAHMPIHMADVGSDNWEHEFTLGLIENENNRIRMIDDALRRIAEKTYGICAATGKKIGMPRLRAKPWAKYCIEYARAREEGRVL